MSQATFYGRGARGVHTRLSHYTMARQGRLRPVRWLGLVVVTCCCMLLVRQNAGVFATTSEDDDNAALSPTAAPETAAPATGDLATESPETGGSAESPTPAPSDGSSEYLGCLGYTNHIKDGYCDTDLNNAECGWDGGEWGWLLLPATR